MATYKLVRNPNPKKDGTKMPYHARFVNEQTVRMPRVIKLETSFSSFSSSDIIGVLEVLGKVLEIELSGGHNVEIEGIGIFTVSLSCPPLYNEKEILSEDVKFKTIKIRVCEKLKRRVRENIHLTKSQEKRTGKTQPHQYKKILFEYLDHYRYITAKQYREKTGLSKSAVATLFRTFLAEGILVKEGSGAGTFYMIPAKE